LRRQGESCTARAVRSATAASSRTASAGSAPSSSSVHASPSTVLHAASSSVVYAAASSVVRASGWRLRAAAFSVCAAYTGLHTTPAPAAPTSASNLYAASAASTSTGIHTAAPTGLHASSRLYTIRV
jgi:hypothetical protein